MRQVGRRFQPARQPEHVLAGAERLLAAKRDCRRRLGRLTERRRRRELVFVAGRKQRERFEIAQVVRAVELEDEGLRMSIDSLFRPSRPHASSGPCSLRISTGCTGCDDTADRSLTVLDSTHAAMLKMSAGIRACRINDISPPVKDSSFRTK